MKRSREQNESVRAGRRGCALVAAVVAAAIGLGAHPRTATAAAPPDLLVVQAPKASTVVGAYRTTIGWTVSWSCASIESACKDTKLSDTLPAGLAIKDVTGSGGLVKKVTVVGNTVTWDLEAPGTPGFVDAGSVGTLSITAAALCDTGADQVFTNVVTLKASNAGTVSSGPSPITVKAAPSCAPPPPPPPSKSTPARLNAGANIPFTLHLPYAPGAYSLIDPTPAGLVVQKVTVEAPGVATVSCDGGTTYQAFDFSKAGPFGKCVKTAGSWNVTHSKFAIPAQADPSWGDSPSVKAVITARVPANTPVGTTFTNVTLTGGPVGKPLTATGTVVPAGTAPTVNKTRDVSPGVTPPVGFGDATHLITDADLGYVIAFGNNGNSETATTPLIDPTITDLLDPNIEYIDGESWWRIASIKNEASLTGTGCRTPTFEKIPNWAGTGRVLLRWQFLGCMFPPANLGNNPAIKMNLLVRSRPGVAPGTAVLNRADILGGAGSLEPMLCDAGTSPDTQDLDGDADTTEATCSSGSGDTWIVPRLATVDATKWVNGASDPAGLFSRFPAVGNTSMAADGAATYELFVDMRGNVAAARIELLDILPFVGDTATLSTSEARKSDWTEELVGPIDLAMIPRASTDPTKSPQDQPQELWQPLTNGATFKYSSSTNPCRLSAPLLGQLHLDGMNYPNGCTPNPWDLTDPVGARSFGLDARTILDPFNSNDGHGDMLRLTVRVKDINDTPTADDADKVAWNSFAYTVTDVDGYEFLSAEPIKVGVAMRSQQTPPPTTEVPTTEVPTTEAPRPTVPTVPLFAVGDQVWLDLNRDGIHDGGETPVARVTVTLLNPDGSPATDGFGHAVPPVVTNEAGRYLFDNLASGDYRIRFTLPDRYEVTIPRAGDNRAVDSNPDADGLTPVFHLTALSPEVRVATPDDGTTNPIDPTIDAGIFLPAIPTVVLPETGVDPVPEVLSATMLLVGGLILIRVRRRRLA